MEKAAVHFNISQHTPLSDDPLALERGEEWFGTMKHILQLPDPYSHKRDAPEYFE